MAKEGFYKFMYEGAAGFGGGILVLDTGFVVGADVTGAEYDGTYKYNPNTNMLDVQITLTVPPGVALVTGMPPSTDEYKIEIGAPFPREFETPVPIDLDTPTGPVRVVVTKIRDFPT